MKYKGKDIGDTPTYDMIYENQGAPKRTRKNIPKYVHSTIKRTMRHNKMQRMCTAIHVRDKIT